jgi:hypothetical protein
MIVPAHICVSVYDSENILADVVRPKIFFVF